MNKTTATPVTAKTVAAKAGKAAKAAKASQIEAEAAAELEAKTGPLGIFATEAVTEGEKEETQVIAPASDLPATDLETPREELEKEYGESTLTSILADRESFLAAAAGFEISVAEAIYRRLTKSDKKTAPMLTKSTYVAAEGGVGPTKRVWEIAAAMKGAKRSDVLAACAAEGIGVNTAKTQYQKFMEAGRSKLTGPKA